jgi:hypothetical protein
MAVAPLRLDVGKIRSTGTKYAWEPGYVESIRGQMNDLQKAFASLMTQFEGATPEICYEALEPTLQKAISYCPIDTGLLRSSAYLEIAGFRGQPRVEMGFARGGVPYYAVLVHEDLEIKHRPPTQAKFLERAVNEDLPVMNDRIAAAFKKYWATGEGK